MLPWGWASTMVTLQQRLTSWLNRLLLVLVESPFCGGTNSRLVRLPLKERRQQALTLHVDICNRWRSIQHNSCKKLRIPLSPSLFSYRLQHCQASFTEPWWWMTRKRGVGGLLQQELRLSLVAASVSCTTGATRSSATCLTWVSGRSFVLQTPASSLTFSSSMLMISTALASPNQTRTSTRYVWTHALSAWTVLLGESNFCGHLCVVGVDKLSTGLSGWNYGRVHYAVPGKGKKVKLGCQVLYYKKKRIYI